MDKRRIMQPISKSISGAKLLGTQYQFSNSHTVPIYDIYTVNGLNQIIGYVKFLNKNYGPVYSRGQAKLYPSLMPNLARATRRAYNDRIIKLIKRVRQDDKLAKAIFHKETDIKRMNLISEAILQHYGIGTYCIDAVDNHWIALWFGHYEYQETFVGIQRYARYTKREPYSIKTDDGIRPAIEYQYILLIAADAGEVSSGFIFGDEVVTIDLRRTIPSIFLRPHAQHGVLLRRVRKRGMANYEDSSSWDLSSNVVCILRLRVSDVEKWLGNGSLLTQDTLIPSPHDDAGYKILLKRGDLFSTRANQITRYSY